MRKNLMHLVMLLAVVLSATALASCSDDNEETHAPVVTIGQVMAGTNVADVSYSVADATTAVYKVIAEGTALPTVDELLADADAKPLDKSATTMSVGGLTPDTRYTIVAAAAYGDKFKSALATASFTTIFETDTKTFKSAVGSFVQRDETTNTALYVIDFSTSQYGDETTMPMSHLYVTLTGANENIDLRNLKIPTGTFTVGDNKNPKAGNFYPGFKNENGEAANTFVGSLKTSADEMEVSLVKDGTITITPIENSQYEVAISFVYDNGNHLEATYRGSIVVDNNSGEIPPAVLLPLPESNLTGNVTVDFNAAKQYGMFTDYGTDRFGLTNRKELFLSLYTDDSYADCVDLYLIVNTDKYHTTLPVGKYPVISEINGANILGNDLCAEPAWRAVAANGARTDLGTWYTWEFAKKAPLVSGEVEVVESDAALDNVHIKFTLKDAKGHTVTGEYKGALDINS